MYVWLITYLVWAALSRFQSCSLTPCCRQRGTQAPFFVQAKTTFEAKTIFENKCKDDLGGTKLLNRSWRNVLCNNLINNKSNKKYPFRAEIVCVRINTSFAIIFGDPECGVQYFYLIAKIFDVSCSLTSQTTFISKIWVPRVYKKYSLIRKIVKAGQTKHYDWMIEKRWPLCHFKK